VPVVLTVGLFLLAFAAQAESLSGIGGTFPALVYIKWGKAAQQTTSLQLTYKAVDSGKGEAAIISHDADFGASEAPMSRDARAANRLLQFPTLIGAIVPIVNLPQVREGELKLTGALLADIYAGNIRKWNDPQIAEINPGVLLPNVSIAIVHRYEASGTSFVFTSYLARASQAWRNRVGAGMTVKWPVGAGAIGNDGVATTVNITRGGIGYVDYAFAVQHHLSMVRLQNPAGAFVRPAPDGFAAAAAAADWNVSDFAVNLIDMPGPAAWPLMTPTFVVVSTDPNFHDRTARAIRFFAWAFAHGGAVAASLGFITLPQRVQDSVRASWPDVLGDTPAAEGSAGAR